MAATPGPFAGRESAARLSRVVHGSDPATAALIVTNLGVLALALYQQWEIGTVLWIYWSQSVIIGFFQFFKILSLRQFTTGGMTSNGMPVAPTRQSQWSLAGFFAIHYGFFHLGYMAFLWTEVPLSANAASLVLSGALLFLLNHALSFALNYRADALRRQHLGRVMLTPYVRIVPMHLAIVFSFLFLSGFGLVLFMLLKTAADTAMHFFEHAGGG